MVLAENLELAECQSFRDLECHSFTSCEPATTWWMSAAIRATRQEYWTKTFISYEAPKDRCDRPNCGRVSTRLEEMRAGRRSILLFPLRFL